MPALRQSLADAGFGNVRTYVQSGNVVLDSELPPEALAQAVSDVIAARFELSIPVVARSAQELAAVVELNPLAEVATNPKRYQVAFLDREPDPAVVERLRAAAGEDEAFAHDGREFYTWHADGVARSKLWAAVAAKGLGVTATSRNWTTVTTLLEMAS